MRVDGSGDAEKGEMMRLDNVNVGESSDGRLHKWSEGEIWSPGSREREKRREERMSAIRNNWQRHAWTDKENSKDGKVGGRTKEGMRRKRERTSGWDAESGLGAREVMEWNWEGGCGC